MIMSYHKRTLELLGMTSASLETEIPLMNWALKHNIDLPQAYLEWAKIDRDGILAKYSPGDWIDLHQPSIVTLPDGRRGLLFYRENQGNFDRIVMLDEGDDPPVLMSFGNDEEEWFQYSQCFSEALFCQIFDWQYALDFSGDYPEIAYYTEFVVANNGLDKLMSRHLELPQTQIIIDEPNPLIQYRLLLPNGNRIIINQDNESAQITIHGTSASSIDQTEDEFILYFQDDVIPPSYTCLLFAILGLNRHLCNRRIGIKLSSLFIQSPRPLESALKRLQLCVEDLAIENLRTSEWDNSSNQSIFNLYIPTANVSVYFIREENYNWKLQSIVDLELD
jgi:hypothetical protein